MWKKHLLIVTTLVMVTGVFLYLANPHIMELVPSLSTSPANPARNAVSGINETPEWKTASSVDAMTDARVLTASSEQTSNGIVIQITIACAIQSTASKLSAKFAFFSASTLEPRNLRIDIPDFIPSGIGREIFPTVPYSMFLARYDDAAPKKFYDEDVDVRNVALLPDKEGPSALGILLNHGRLSDDPSEWASHKRVLLQFNVEEQQVIVTLHPNEKPLAAVMGACASDASSRATETVTP